MGVPRDVPSRQWSCSSELRGHVCHGLRGSFLHCLSVPFLLLLVVLLAEGCAKPFLLSQAQEPIPVPAPSPTPSSTSPRAAALTSLLNDAQDVYARGRYAVSARLLQHILETYPQSPLMEKTRLTLARTYEQAGNMRNALETYRCIVQEYGQDTNRDRHIVREARSRMSALLPRAELERRSANGMVGVRVSPSSLPPREQRVEWIRNLKEGGITFIVLDVGTPPPLNSAHG